MDLENIPHHKDSVNISKISRTTCQLVSQRIGDGGKVLCEAPASGFFWRRDDRCFLVTNRHVFSGTDAFSGRLMGFIPNSLTVHAFAEQHLETGEVKMVSLQASISLIDEAEQPLWHEHPSGREIDIAVMALSPEIEDGFYLGCLNGTGIQENGSIFVGDDVFIVGYPEGKKFDRAMPLWKRGSLATDPDLNQMSLPQLYIDTLGNKGLSGSPVISKLDAWDRPDKRSREKEGQIYQFLGIYAGRLGEKGLGSQVGRVFKAKALNELLDSIL